MIHWTRQPGIARQRRVLLTQDVLLPAGDVAVVDDLSADELTTGGAAIFLDGE